MTSRSTWASALFLIGFLGYRFLRFRSLRKQIPDLIQKGAIIIDVRSAAEFQNASNPQSINVPLDQIGNTPLPYPKEGTLILCCASGTRSGIAVGILKLKGFNAVFNAGPWTNTL
jgi:rhodanese-related sulfurtransferase